MNEWGDLISPWNEVIGRCVTIFIHLDNSVLYIWLILYRPDPAKLDDPFSVQYIVKGAALGRTMLQFIARPPSSQTISSQPKEIQVRSKSPRIKFGIKSLIRSHIISTFITGKGNSGIGLKKKWLFLTLRNKVACHKHIESIFIIYIKYIFILKSIFNNILKNI